MGERLEGGSVNCGILAVKLLTTAILERIHKYSGTDQYVFPSYNSEMKVMGRKRCALPYTVLVLKKTKGAHTAFALGRQLC